MESATLPAMKTLEITYIPKGVEVIVVYIVMTDKQDSISSLTTEIAPFTLFILKPFHIKITTDDANLSNKGRFCQFLL